MMMRSVAGSEIKSWGLRLMRNLKRETKLGAPLPIRHMHAAVQPNRTNNDCEEKLDPDERPDPSKMELIKR